MSSNPPDDSSDPSSTFADPTTPRFATEEEAQEYEQLRQEMFEVWGRLARSGIGVNTLRQSVLLGQALTPCRELRDDFDRIRLELDAYLRSIAEGDAAVRATDDFIPSPELSREDVQRVITALFGAVPSDDETPH
ncbi:MAG: hypothetical protein KDK70_12195 [Myxococcales bacterium]|nr:hypothetical protein [Myxococcales bacterium]